MSMQPVQRFPNGIVPPSELICQDKAVEMPEPCKGWNDETVPPFTPLLGRRRWNWHLHIATATTTANKVKSEKVELLNVGYLAIEEHNLHVLVDVDLLCP